jgi:cytidylate kinase
MLSKEANRFVRGLCMAVIAISQQIGSRGSVLGELTARELGYRFMTGEQIIATTAARYNVSAEQVKWFDVHNPHFWERKTDSHRYLAFSRAVLLQEAAQDRLVVVGRSSSHFVPENCSGLRVRVVAPIASRIQQVAQDEQLQPAAADRRVRDYDAEVKARSQSLFGIDIDDAASYDLVINTARHPLPHLVAMLAAMAAQIDAEDIPDRRAALYDASIAAQVHAALVAHPKIRDAQVSVNCSSGCVRVSGPGLVPPWDELVIGVAQQIDGVASVEVGADEAPITFGA